MKLGYVKELYKRYPHTACKNTRKKSCDITAKITTFSANLSWKIRVEKNIEPA